MTADRLILAPLADVHIRIRPTRGWTALDARAIWANRELLYFLIWRDLKVRYAQTALGAAWAVLQPLSMMLLFTVLFSRIPGLHTVQAPYALFAYAGLIPWTFFSNATTLGAHSLVGSAHILTKVYFPRLLIPLAAILSCLVDLLLALAMLVPLMAFYRTAPGWHLLWLPVAVALTTVVAFGAGVWIAAVNVKYRDVRYALPFTMQLLLFASPIFYSIDQLPARWHWVIGLNPVAAPIALFRAALLGFPIDPRVLLMSGAATLLLLAAAAVTFRHVEHVFADIV
jgi:lipopolysaccharide transport system permease protein